MTDYRYAHPVDEPCPDGCPTRNTEIADAASGYFAAYTPHVPLTADDVTKALETPASLRDGVQHTIAEVAETWV